MTPIFVPLAQALVDGWRAGLPDAHGAAPERRIADGSHIPCRATLALVPAGQPYLVLAHRPFAGLNPYTETGPIFVAATDGPVAMPGPDLPPFLVSPRDLLRGYDTDERIVYGTGTPAATGEIPAVAAALLARPEVAFLHLRSATNGCFHCRIARG